MYTILDGIPTAVATNANGRITTSTRLNINILQYMIQYNITKDIKRDDLIEQKTTSGAIHSEGENKRICLLDSLPCMEHINLLTYQQ